MTNTSDVNAPQWRELYRVALLELDPTKSPKLIAEARSAILDKIEDGFSKPNPEQVALGDALAMLSRLRTIVEREISQKKTA